VARAGGPQVQLNNHESCSYTRVGSYAETLISSFNSRPAAFNVRMAERVGRLIPVTCPCSDGMSAVGVCTIPQH
jgi:hypothetical protein